MDFRDLNVATLKDMYVILICSVICMHIKF